MTSPQYHIKFDDNFDTVQDFKEESHGWWLQKCGFTSKLQRNNVMDFTTDHRNSGPRQTTIATQNENDNNSEQVITEDNNADPFDYDQQEVQHGEEDAPQEDILVHEGAPVQEQPNHPPPPITRRSARSWKPTAKILESIQQDDIALPTR